MNRGGKQKRMTTKRVLAVWLAALVVILALIWFFRNFISRYQDSITAESASHLVEISYQVASYIEGKIDNDWKVAESIADGFQTREQAETDDLLAFMRNEQDKFKKHMTSVLPLSLMVSMPLFSAMNRHPREGNR